MRNKKAFTLIELLAVIVILGIILTISIPQVTNYIASTRAKSMRTAAQTYIDAVRSYCTSNNEFPYKGKSKVYNLNYIVNTIGLDKKATKSPYGNEWDLNNSYVRITMDMDYNDTYSVLLIDSKGYGLQEETLEKNLVNIGVVNRAETGSPRYNVSYNGNHDVTFSYTDENGISTTNAGGSVNLQAGTEVTLTSEDGEVTGYELSYPNGEKETRDGNVYVVEKNATISEIFIDGETGDDIPGLSGLTPITIDSNTTVKSSLSDILLHDTTSGSNINSTTCPSGYCFSIPNGHKYYVVNKNTGAIARTVTYTKGGSTNTCSNNNSDGTACEMTASLVSITISGANYTGSKYLW